MHEDIQNLNTQIRSQQNLTIKIEIIVKTNNLTNHPFSLSQSDIAVQSLPPPFICTELDK